MAPRRQHVRPPDTHACEICGAPAAFGFGPPLRRARIWTCAAHRAEGEAPATAFPAAPAAAAPGPAKPRTSPPRSGARGDLFGGV